MASNQNGSLFHCTRCQESLNLQSHTLPCLHSFCPSCFDQNITECPECHEHLTSDQFSLSPFLAKSLNRQRLESADSWTCDLCSESEAQFWCQDCQNILCTNCCNIHTKVLEKINQNHFTKDLTGMERDEAIKEMMMDTCSLHSKIKDLYCQQCNICLCDTCYETHSTESSDCSSQRLSVGEALSKEKSKGPNFIEQMDDLEIKLKDMIGMTKDYTVGLEADCDLKCKEIWQSYEEMMENAKKRTMEFCEEMKKITAEQVEKWRCIINENERILKQLEIWRVNLDHLLKESQPEMDVVCGLGMLGSKILTQSQKPVGLEKCELLVTYFTWWMKALDQLKSGMMGSVYSRIDVQHLILDKQWNLDSMDMSIISIHVSKEDEHIFLGDCDNNCIMELNESGDVIFECKLIQGTNKFRPVDICSISSDILIVPCGRENKLIILERWTNHPLLKIKKVIPTEKKYYSVCKINGSIYAYDLYLQIYMITEEGEILKTINTGRELACKITPRIRVNPSNGNLWGTELDSTEIFSYNSVGEKLQSGKTEQITDFCVDTSGQVFFSNWGGLFSHSTGKIIQEFENRSEIAPKIFHLKNKIFICLKIKGQYLIKIFKILN